MRTPSQWLAEFDALPDIEVRDIEPTVSEWRPAIRAQARTEIHDMLTGHIPGKRERAEQVISRLLAREVVTASAGRRRQQYRVKPGAYARTA